MYDISLSGLNVMVRSPCPLEVDTETSVSFTVKNPDHALGVQVVVPTKLIAIKGDTLSRGYKLVIMPRQNTGTPVITILS